MFEHIMKVFDQVYSYLKDNYELTIVFLVVLGLLIITIETSFWTAISIFLLIWLNNLGSKIK